MQCKDIPDDVFMKAVELAPSPNLQANAWKMRWEVHWVLESMIGEIPEKLLMAKARKLMSRKILGGCDCGCRGDWHDERICEGPY